MSYVAVGSGGSTFVERVDTASGKIERERRLSGSFGVPGVAYDGSDTGLSADGRTLVLAAMPGNGNGIPRQTGLVVLNARLLVTRARIVLPGYYVVDAISPTGRWLYLISLLLAERPEPIRSARV